MPSAVPSGGCIIEGCHYAYSVCILRPSFFKILKFIASGFGRVQVRHINHTADKQLQRSYQIGTGLQLRVAQPSTALTAISQGHTNQTTGDGQQAAEQSSENNGHGSQCAV